MAAKDSINYNRIAKAIDFIRSNFKDQPNLDEVARYVNLSPYHFQRMFTEWAGTSPKKFLQYISVEHAKQVLRTHKASISEAAFETGLSSSSRLHDMFINIEAMTPAEYKNGGKQLTINYSFAESLFGNLLVASTAKGICHMAFYEDQATACSLLEERYPKAHLENKSDPSHSNALSILQSDWGNLPQIKLHLKGTDFQLKVWQALLKIPVGWLETYGGIAGLIDKPKASRAVGTAIGSNPVAFLIPCHRVIQSTGSVGGYMWGQTRKTAIIGWEASISI